MLRSCLSKQGGVPGPRTELGKDVEEQGPSLRLEWSTNPMLFRAPQTLESAWPHWLNLDKFLSLLGLVFHLKKEFLKALCSPPGVGGEWVCLSPTHTLASLKCVELLTSRQTFRVASFYESMYLIRWVFLFLLYWIE